MLKVEGLNAGYGSVNILWDIGFEVKDGEIVAILGSNGAGKTTMVRTITGMVKASSGKVEFNGEDLSGKSSRVILDSGIVQVPEGRQLFTEMTVLENLELGAFNKETKAGCRHPVRRRAADGGRGPCADRYAQAADPG